MIYYTDFLKRKKAVIVCHNLDQIFKVECKTGLSLKKKPEDKLLTKLLKTSGYCVANNGYTGTVDYYKAQKDVVMYDYEDVIFDDNYIRVNKERKTVSLFEKEKLVTRVRCHEEDEFDLEVGLGIALTRKHANYKPLQNDLSILKALGCTYVQLAKFVTKKLVNNLDEVLEKGKVEGNNLVIKLQF